jgi:outer membrane autotransporter protein
VEGIIPVVKEQGIYATVGALGHWGKSDIRRGYTNFSAPDSSEGSPDTRTWGIRTRLDWQNAFFARDVAISPYVDLSYTDSHMDGYTETGGGIPAQFDSRDNAYTEARLGFNAAKPLNIGKLSLVTNIEAAHRFGDHGAGTSGEVDGLFTFSLPGDKVSTDWIKAGVGVEGDVGPGKLSLMLNGTSKSDMPNVWLAASYQMAF